MYRLSASVRKLLPGRFPRFTSDLLPNSKWTQNLPLPGSELASVGPYQCACLATAPQRKKYPKHVQTRIKYQKSNDKLFRREKIQRSLSETEAEGNSSLSGCLKDLDDGDQFGTLAGDEIPTTPVRKKKEKIVKSESESLTVSAEQKTFNKLRNESRITDSKPSKGSTQNRRSDNLADKHADTFGNVGKSNLARGLNRVNERERVTLELLDLEPGTAEVEKSATSQFEDVKSSESSPELPDGEADEFGTIAENFKEKFLKPGPITKANVDLRMDESSEVHEDFHLRLSKFNRKHPQEWYERRLEKLAKDGQILEALDLLEKTMIEKDRVMPTAFAFTVVIDAMAKYGYPQGAFKLFRKLLAYKLTPFDQTYTALFNACANCPDKAMGLKYATRFREALAKKDILPNRTTYKAMMKAYAMFGDLQTTFALADELYEKRGRIDHDSFSHMLMGAVSDGDAGFKHAVEVFRSIRKHRLTPSITHYNLLLRAMRDCGVGSQEFLHQLLGGGETASLPSGGDRGRTLKQNNQKYIKDGSTDRLVAGINATMKSADTQDDSKSLSPANVMTFLDIQSENLSMIPNILSPNPDTTQLITIADIKTAPDRLQLVGGVPGLLAHMHRDSVTPDVKSFTLLLDVMPSETRMEDMLVATMKHMDVVPDVGFFNILMRKRVFRRDFAAARLVLDYLVSCNLTPDIKTFGVFALTCKMKREAFVLLSDMKNIGLEPTPEIMSHLCRASEMNFGYKRAIVVYMQKHGLKPNEHFLRQTEAMIRKGKKYIVDKEHGEKVPYYARKDSFNEVFGSFLKVYKPWLVSIDVVVPEPYWKKFTDHRDAGKEEKLKTAEKKKSVFLRKDVDEHEDDVV